MRQFSFPLILALGLTGCVAEDGFLMSILDSPARNAQCIFPANPQAYLSRGRLDASFGNPFTLGMTILSSLVDEDEDTRVCAGAGDACADPQNRITLLGFDACFFREASLPADIDDSDIASGRLLDCDALPAAQNRFVPSAGTLLPGETGVATLQILETADVEALYSGLDISAIPVGTFNIEDPADAARDPAWGAFPEAREDRVLIQTRARGKLPTGRSIQSNWYTFGITLGMGSVKALCPEPIPALCDCTTGPCNETTGQCPDGSACATGDVGTVAGFGEGCAPWEFDAEIVCLPYSSCPVI